MVWHLLNRDASEGSANHAVNSTSSEDRIPKRERGDDDGQPAFKSSECVAIVRRRMLDPIGWMRVRLSEQYEGSSNDRLENLCVRGSAGA